MRNPSEPLRKGLDLFRDISFECGRNGLSVQNHSGIIILYVFLEALVSLGAISQRFAARSRA